MSDNQEKENPGEESEEKESMAVPVDGVAKPQDQPAMKESVAVHKIFPPAEYGVPEGFYNPRRVPGMSVQRRAAKQETAIPRNPVKAFRGLSFGLESPEFPSLFTSPVEALHGAESPAYPLSSVNFSRAAESTTCPLRTPVKQPHPVKEPYRPLLRTKAFVQPRSSRVCTGHVVQDMVKLIDDRAALGDAMSYAGYAAAGRTLSRPPGEPIVSRFNAVRSYTPQRRATYI
jgi:hypothetical protein